MRTRSLSVIRPRMRPQQTRVRSRSANHKSGPRDSQEKRTARRNSHSRSSNRQRHPESDSHGAKPVRSQKRERPAFRNGPMCLDDEPETKVVKFTPHVQEEPSVIYDGGRFLCVYKPSSWNCTTTKHVSCRDVSRKIQTWLQNKFKRFRLLADAEHSSGLCHRLDIETSGVLLVATDRPTWVNLRNQMTTKKKVRKEYCALMHGVFPEDMQSGKITYQLKTVPKRNGWLTRVDAKNGKPAETHYEVIKTYRWPGTSQRYTLLKLRILTGRTHQIRVHIKEHAQQIGLTRCGLVGDYKYLSPEQLAEDQRFCGRVFLHAKELEFRPPGSHGDSAWAFSSPPHLASLGI